MAQPTLRTGLYGKVPTYGDFLHRGLPSSFVEPWNDWVSRSIVASRMALGDGWLEAYLTSPPWRFVLEPGILGGAGWLGVLASSVDQVSRCYPMALAIALPENCRLALLTQAIEPIFEVLEEAILHLIEGSWTVDAAMLGLDQAARLLAKGPITATVFTRGGRERLMIGPGPAPLAALAARWRLEQPAEQDEPLSAWLHAAWSHRDPETLIATGLPSPEIFVTLLDGGWIERDWTSQDAGSFAP